MILHCVVLRKRDAEAEHDIAMPEFQQRLFPLGGEEKRGVPCMWATHRALLCISLVVIPLYPTFPVEKLEDIVSS